MRAFTQLSPSRWSCFFPVLLLITSTSRTLNMLSQLICTVVGADNGGEGNGGCWTGVV